MSRQLRYRVLFAALVTPVGIAGRLVWRRRLALDHDPRRPTYWHDRRREVVGPDSLRQLP